MLCGHKVWRQNQGGHLYNKDGDAWEVKKRGLVPLDLKVFSLKWSKAGGFAVPLEYGAGKKYDMR